MQCKHTKADEQRCRARCITGSAFCFFHDPKTRDAHREATVKGGKERLKPAPSLPPGTPDAQLVNNHDVRAFIAETLNQVRTGKVSVAIGNCLFVGAGVLLKSIDASELQQRIAEVEAQLQQRGRGLAR